jgi:4-hydroxy-tetrahydrodipicolinate synthase
MLTPFTENNEVDYHALEQLIEWYIKSSVAGLFAVCQSSEMVYLSLEERVAIASFVKEKAKGRVPVIASGHISDSMDAQIEEINKIAQTGVEAVVLVSGRIAQKNESEDVWKENVKTLLDEIPKDIQLGFYECPYPYKRIISPELLRWCADTGRFSFLKDTSCDIDIIKAKLEAVKNTPLKIFNANTATLLRTLEDGISGYCGVMANFHPDLYVWLVNNYERHPEQSERLSDFLGLASVIELQVYPVNAKYSLAIEGLDLRIDSRAKEAGLLTASKKMEVEQLHALTQRFRKEYSLIK